MHADLKVAVSEIGPCRRELTIEVAAERVASARDAVERELMRVARVPGFRVGHAPRALVAQQYRAKAQEETIRRVIREVLPKALDEARVDPLGDPEVTQVALDDGRPSFTVRCEVLPAITVRGLKGLKVTRPLVHVTEPQVAEVLAQLQERHAELVPVAPRPLAAGDFAVADLTCTVEGKVIDSRKDAVIRLTPEEDPHGFTRHLIGVAPALTPVTCDTTLPQDLSAKPYAGKPATWTITVKDVKVKQVPPLDEPFARIVGAESLEQLRARVRQDLERELAAQSRRAVEGQVIQALLAKTPFEVPASVVQSQAQRLLREHQLRLLYQGAAPTEVEQRQSLLVEQSTRDALRQVKSFFLLRQVAKDQQLAATEPEIEARLQALAAQSQRPVEQVRADLKKRELLGELAWDVTRAKVVDFVLTQAEIREEAS